MKYFKLVSIVLYSFVFFHWFTIAYDPDFKDENEFLVTTVIMIKNEADNIIDTLKPMVEGGITSFLVYDTGSTDGTQDLVKEYFKQCGLDHAYLIEEPFVDFATSRNRLLDLAEQIFVNSTFVLMVDAEWYLHNVEELIDFCKQHKNYIAPNCTGSTYFMRLFTASDSMNNYTTRLIRQGYNIRYHGVVHESIAEPASGVVPESVYFEYRPQVLGQEKSKARFARDYELLKKSHEDNPTNMRTLFYLGQTCQFLGDWDQAIEFYKKRLALGELSEEKYLAAYRIGFAIEYILEELQDEELKKKYQWADALNYYCIAHTMLPSRAEPLFRIACHYIRNKQHPVAYLFAIRAAQLPYPSKQALFIEDKVYRYLRYDILGQCALYAGEYTAGKAAVLLALEQDPDNQSLYHNLYIYDKCLEQLKCA